MYLSIIQRTYLNQAKDTRLIERTIPDQPQSLQQKNKRWLVQTLSFLIVVA